MQSDNNLIVRVYQSVLEGVPYNSVSPVFNVAKKTPPVVFGDNCIGQADQVRERLGSEGIDGAYFLRDGRHHAVIAPYQGALFLLNPYLMHKEPINLTEILDSNGKQKEFGAYPKVTDNLGRVREGYFAVIFEKSDHRFIIEKGRFNPNSSEYTVSRFFLDLNDPQYQRPSPDDTSIAFHPEQTSLSIRVLDMDLGELTHLVYPVHKVHGSPVSRNHLYVKTNRGSKVSFLETADFDRTVSRIATTLNCSVEEMLRFIEEGAVLYEQLAPKDIEFVSHNPTNM